MSELLRLILLWNELIESLFAVFIDQPVGVGFSYSDPGIQVATTEQAALDVHSFLTIFFDAFTEFKNRPFHLAGESYGGRYLPVFASEIVYQNSLVKKKNGTATPINLKSVMIGNGLTDVVRLFRSFLRLATSSRFSRTPPGDDGALLCLQLRGGVLTCDLRRPPPTMTKPALRRTVSASPSSISKPASRCSKPSSAARPGLERSAEPSASSRRPWEGKGRADALFERAVSSSPSAISPASGARSSYSFPSSTEVRTFFLGLGCSFN